MKVLGTIFAVIIALYLFTKWRGKSLASSGNPNYPLPQESPTVGPQGPNDGSNSFVGSGHTIYAGPSSDLRKVIEYPLNSRAFAYAGGNESGTGQVARKYSVY